MDVKEASFMYMLHRQIIFTYSRDKLQVNVPEVSYM